MGTTTTKKVKVNGQVIEATNASLSPLMFKGYWADTNGVRIDKISFGSKVRFYTERWQAYNAKLKIYIKSSVKDVPIVEGAIDKLIDGYFTKRELYYEMTLNKLSQYESLRGAQNIELCCDVAKGFGSYGEMREVAKIKITSPSIIFPLLIKPLNNKGGNRFSSRYNWNSSAGSSAPTFGSSRSRGNRKHAGRDLYAVEIVTEVVSICDGIILANNRFYNATNEISVLHTTNDGRVFIARYGEVSPNSVTVKVGDKVTQSQVIAKVGKLNPPAYNEKTVTNMLHFELYSGANGHNLKKALTDTTNGSKYLRRSDLVDPIVILEEGYKNTFND